MDYCFLQKTESKSLNWLAGSLINTSHSCTRNVEAGSYDRVVMRRHQLSGSYSVCTLCVCVVKYQRSDQWQAAATSWSTVSWETVAPVLYDIDSVLQITRKKKRNSLIHRKAFISFFSPVNKWSIHPFNYSKQSPWGLGFTVLCFFTVFKWTHPPLAGDWQLVILLNYEHEHALARRNETTQMYFLCVCFSQQFWSSVAVTGSTWLPAN